MSSALYDLIVAVFKLIFKFYFDLGLGVAIDAEENRPIKHVIASFLLDCDLIDEVVCPRGVKRVLIGWVGALEAHKKVCVT